MPDARLTQLAHSTLREVLREGDFAVDATAGNGHDTVFLANAVGAAGHVFAFDLQQAALDATRARLEQRIFARRVTLLQRGHEHLGASLPPHWRGAVAAVMFNLGYLPRGDRVLTTRPQTTLPALETAVGWLREGGMLTVIAYTRHLGGKAESEAVLHWLRKSPAAQSLQWTLRGNPAGEENHPWLAMGKRV